MPHPDRIRAGAIIPLIGEGADGALRSASIIRDELDTLDDDDPRRADLKAQELAWLNRAATLQWSR